MSLAQRAAEVSAVNLGWRYRGASSDALADISLEIPAGSVTLLTGESGSGKSTFAALLAGLLDPVEDGHVVGELTVGGRPPDRSETPVGVVLQQPDDQTILHRLGDDVAFGLENTALPREQMPSRIMESLQHVGLDLPLDFSTEHLSGGQRQRLAMAGALAMRPGLMVLDEPLQALDQAGRLMVVSSLTRLHQLEALTVVIVDHDPQPWRDVVDTVVEFTAGRVRGVWSVDKAPLEWHRGVDMDPPSPVARGNPLCVARDLVIGRDRFTLPGKHNLECRSGEILALVGPNGSGKSTLALTLAGLLPPLGGEVLHPPSAHSLPSADLASLVAFVPQNPDHHALGNSVRADVEVTLLAQRRPAAERSASVTEVSERYGLGAVLDRHPQSLSGGEARRVALAGAVVTGAPLIILDEPSQSLDARAWEVLVRDLRELAAAGRAIVIVTHDRALIAALGAREYLLSAPEEPPVVEEPEFRPRWLVRANPLSLFLAATVVALGLLISLNLVSSAVAAGGIVLALTFSGALRVRSLLALWPIALAAFFASITIALYGQESGAVVWEWGLMSITQGSLTLAGATGLRIVAIATPAVVLFRGVDATALADALSQKLRLPERFVVGALAGVRLVQVLGRDLSILRMSRRSRGLGDDATWRSLPREVFSLVVIALRRAGVLATAMEARGFGRSRRRTHYRVSRWSPVDGVVVVASLVLVVSALTSAALAGVWAP